MLTANNLHIYSTAAFAHVTLHGLICCVLVGFTQCEGAESQANTLQYLTPMAMYAELPNLLECYYKLWSLHLCRWPRYVIKRGILQKQGSSGMFFDRFAVRPRTPMLLYMRCFPADLACIAPCKDQHIVQYSVHC